MLESASRLKLCLLCDLSTPTAKMLKHSPPLPLIVDINSIYLDPDSSGNVIHALQHPDRVVSISIDTWAVDCWELLEALDKSFPALETFSLLVAQFERPNRLTLHFPQKFISPRLHTLYLENVNFFEVPSLLASAATSLVSVRIEQIEVCSYIPPDELVWCISCMPRLEELSICFLVSHRLPVSEREFWDTQITRTVLSSLRELTFGGDSAYLEKTIALVSTPLLQYFDVTFYSQPTLAVQHISDFLSTIQNLDFRAAAVSFSDTVAITYRPTNTSDSLSRLKFRIDDETDGLNQQVAILMQICAAVGLVLNAVEDVAIEFDRCYVPDDFAVRSELWHTILRSFEALRTLRIDIALVPELSKVLYRDNGTATEELLPMLSELVVMSRIDLIHNPFASLIDARSLAGRAINFQVIKRRNPPPQTSAGPFDALYERNDSAMEQDYANITLD